MTLSQSVLFATWKFVFENADLELGLGKVDARDQIWDANPAGRPSHWFHCSRPLDPTQLQSRHMQVELDPCLWLRGSSQSQTVLERRALPP